MTSTPNEIPEWLTVGATVGVLISHDRVSTATVARFTKTRVYVATGSGEEWYPLKTLERSSSTWGPTYRLVPLTDKRFVQLRQTAVIKAALGQLSQLGNKLPRGQRVTAESLQELNRLAKRLVELTDQETPSVVSAIAPARLVELRVEARQNRTQFVDPVVLDKCWEVLRRRGERWAAVVLGRDITRRSPGVPHLPWLHDGEEYTLVAADVEEDRARFAQITAEPAGEKGAGDA